ncbi:unnamed protein product, partial [Chrysoparadoxa australica]
MNKQGGVARVTKANQDGTFDVRYLVVGGSEKKVEGRYLTHKELDEGERPREVLGRCKVPGCQSFIVHCNHLQPQDMAFEEGFPAGEASRATAQGLDGQALAGEQRSRKTKKKKRKKEKKKRRKIQSDGESEEQDEAASEASADDALDMWGWDHSDDGDGPHYAGSSSDESGSGSQAPSESEASDASDASMPGYMSLLASEAMEAGGYGSRSDADPMALEEQDLDELDG